MWPSDFLSRPLSIYEFAKYLACCLASSWKPEGFPHRTNYSLDVVYNAIAWLKKYKNNFQHSNLINF